MKSQGELYQRLKAMQKNRFGAERPPGWAGPGSPGANTLQSRSPGADWQELTEGVWTRQTFHRLPPAFLRHHEGLKNLSLPFLNHGPQTPGGGLDHPGPAGPDQGNILALDTETTGLSSGAGTVAFLIGWAQRQGENLAVRQFFLGDFPAEPRLLAAVEAALEAEQPCALRTYNGACFDLPLLRTRWIMNGRFFPEPEHRDILAEVRRFWRLGAQSCRLSDVEHRILHIERQGDPGGAQVPLIYLDWLGGKPGTESALEAVCGHHVQDVLSLWCLQALLEQLKQVLDGIGYFFQSSATRADGPGWEARQGGQLLMSVGAQGGEWSADLGDLPVSARGIWHYWQSRGQFQAAAGLVRQILDHNCLEPWWYWKAAADLDPWTRSEASWELWLKRKDPRCLRDSLIQLEHPLANPTLALSRLESQWPQLVQALHWPESLRNLPGAGGPEGPGPGRYPPGYVQWRHRLRRLQTKHSALDPDSLGPQDSRRPRL